MKITVTYRVDKVLYRSKSKIWKQLEVGDDLIMTFNTSDNHRVDISKRRSDTEEIVSLGTTSWSVMRNILDRPSFELTRLDIPNLKGRLESYCKFHCLTSECPDVCSECPLHNSWQ